MQVQWLGPLVTYADGMARMREAMARVDEAGPVLLLMSHTPTITITRRGGTGAFLAPRELIERDGIEVIETDRGGDVTFHGPGQLVGYPVLRLGPSSLGSNVVGYVRALEQGLVDACRALGVVDAHQKSSRDADGNHLTGVWCKAPVVEAASCSFVLTEHQDAKVCAIGVGLSGGVTRHGFALNVTTDIERFTRHITPCGLTGRTATSLERALPRPPSFERTRDVVSDHVVSALHSFHSPLHPSTIHREEAVSHG